jgi:restriction endonuclease EcoRII-like protein
VSSPASEQAILDAHRVGRALLKFISPNDVGLTGGHQKGYYLPKGVWHVFTTFAPKQNVNNDHRVEAVWQDGRVTESTVKWYGTKTRSEYRLTGFNRERDFPFIAHDCVGSLLVLIPESMNRFLMYVLDEEDDIEDIQAALGVEAVRGWAVYDSKAALPPETENDCIDRHFRTFTGALTKFPATLAFADEARAALSACVNDFVSGPTDDQLMRCIAAEYSLFRIAERKLSEPDVVRVFKDIDDFLATAQTILQRRKARAGKSLEHHVEYLLKQAKIPYQRNANVEGTKPDILIPHSKQYLDRAWPDKKLFVIGIKTTCKDRWRQVLQEAPRVRRKHILTLQKGISPAQLTEMKKAAVTLVVPKELHADYPKDRRAELVTIAALIDKVKAALAA